MNEQQVIRELMVALEHMRAVCEHHDCSEHGDKHILHAMKVGMRTNAKFAHLIPDYQRPSFWKDVHQHQQQKQKP
jgi:hypothetical protein